MARPLTFRDLQSPGAIAGVDISKDTRITRRLSKTFLSVSNLFLWIVLLVLVSCAVGWPLQTNQCPLKAGHEARQRAEGNLPVG